MRRHIAVTLIFALMFFAVSGAAGIQVATSEYSGAITINDDGSVSPPSAPISNAGDSIYAFTADIHNSIVVARSNIVVGGNGYTLYGQSLGDGISLSGVTNVTVRNIAIEGQFENGIHLDNSFGNTLIGNRIKNSFANGIAYGCFGMRIDPSSPNNKISENTVENCYQGIYVYSSNNNISTNNVVDCSWGISIYGDDNCIYGNSVSSCDNTAITVNSFNDTVSMNTATDSHGGIIYCSPNSAVPGNSVFRGNHMSNNAYNFGCSGINDVDASNTVNGKPVLIWMNQRDKVVPVDAGYIVLINCQNITVQNLNLSNNNEGILLEGTTNSTIVHNVFANNSYGISLSANSNFNRILENTLTNNVLGMHSEYSSFNEIAANKANNLQGMSVDSSSNNSVYANNIVNNKNYGLLLGSSRYDNVSANNITNSYYGLTTSMVSHSTFSGNNITNNFYGIYMDSTSQTELFRNNFVNNNKQVYSYRPCSGNVWDDGYPSGGNYWSDYNGSDANGDGIGETPYIIDSGTQDRYPIISPFNVSITLTSPAYPTQTPAPTATPTPETNPTSTSVTTPTPSPTNSTTNNPESNTISFETPTPEQNTASQPAAFIFAATASAIAAIATKEAALRKKKQPNGSSTFANASHSFPETIASATKTEPPQQTKEKNSSSQNTKNSSNRFCRE